MKLKDIWKWLKGEGPTLVINARDGDGDGIIQEGTPFERPAKKKKATPSAKKPVAKKPVAKKAVAAKKPAAKKATPKKK